MIRINKTINGILVPQDSIARDCWVNIFVPTEAEMSKVAEATGIPWDFLADPLDADERSRLDMENDCLLVVIQAPLYNDADDRIPYITMPIGIIITPEVVVTVCRSPSDLVGQLLSVRSKHINTQESMRFTMHLMQRVAMNYLRDLKDISRMALQLEEELYKSSRNKELISLLNLGKSLVYFITSLEANGVTMSRLLQTKLTSLSEDEEDLLEDALTENRQALGVARIHSDILSSVSDALAGIISNNMNTVIKFLTGFTIIVMVPNIITSAYGMNTALPFADDGNILYFCLIMLTSLALSCAVWWFFRKKRWL
jgi:magnesium transporter